MAHTHSQCLIDTDEKYKQSSFMQEKENSKLWQLLFYVPLQTTILVQIQLHDMNKVVTNTQILKFSNVVVGG